MYVWINDIIIIPDAINTFVELHDPSEKTDEGHSVSLFCGINPIHYRHTSNTSWFHDTIRVRIDDWKYVTKYRGRLLMIQNLTVNDHGNYSCKLQSEYFISHTHSLYFDVKGKFMNNIPFHISIQNKTTIIGIIIVEQLVLVTLKFC